MKQETSQLSNACHGALQVVCCQQVEDLIAKELALARELIAAKRRERALLALKRKKLREGQLEQIDAYLLNVEQASSFIPWLAYRLPLQVDRCIISPASCRAILAQRRCFDQAAQDSPMSPWLAS